MYNKSRECVTHGSRNSCPSLSKLRTHWNAASAFPAFLKRTRRKLHKVTLHDVSHSSCCCYLWVQPNTIVQRHFQRYSHSLWRRVGVGAKHEHALHITHVLTWTFILSQLIIFHVFFLSYRIDNLGGFSLKSTLQFKVFEKWMQR